MAATQDPALSTGVLPNGMRYYLRVNCYPAGRAEFRLVVNAGSVLEDPDQRGLAHFLEHMAFNGTRHFPQNAILDFIETSGMRFGADLNAYTSFDETVYMLKLPTDDPKRVAQGLDVLQDWADGGMLIDSNEVVAERGVVMAEWRLRSLVDTAVSNYHAHYDTLLYGGSPYLARGPIGDTLTLATAEPGPLRRFYADWYRPDLMAIVVVGDFDRAQMLSELTRRFGDIPARARPRPRPTPAIPTPARPVVDIYRARVSPQVEVFWPAPATPSAPALALRQALIHELLWMHLQNRLTRIREQPSRPFITAALEQGRLVRPLNLVGFTLTAWPDSLMRGLEAVLTEIQRIAQHGVPESMLAHEKTVLLRRLEAAAEGALARPSAAYASAYVAHYLTGDVLLLSPEQELALGREMLPTITPAVLSEAVQQIWGNHARRRVFVRVPMFSHATPPTREGVLALFDSVQRTAIPPEHDVTVTEGPLLEQLPTLGRITGERQDSVSGITEWTLSNGAHVLLKPSSNDPDQLLIRAWSPGGFSRMPDALFFTPGRMVGKLMTAMAGLGSEDRDAPHRRLATSGLRHFRVHIGYAEESIDLGGSPRDVEMLFQLLHRQFTSPKVDSAAIRSWASLAKYQGSGATSSDQIDQLFARGEPRLRPVSTQLAELLTPADALAAYHDRFGNAADFTFILVGALTPTEARPLVERYIASLPATGARETPKPLGIKPFVQKIERTNWVDPLPKAHTTILFDGPFPSEPDAYLRSRQEFGALMTILQGRIRMRIREELGGDYSPHISGYTHLFPVEGQPSSEHYRVLGGFLSAPERMQTLWTEFERILESVRTHGAAEGELVRAATIQRRQHEAALESNTYWLNVIEQYHRLGIPFARIIEPFDSVTMTPQSLRAAAQRFLPSDVYIHLTTMPRDSTTYTSSDRSDSSETNVSPQRGAAVDSASAVCSGVPGDPPAARPSCRAPRSGGPQDREVVPGPTPHALCDGGSPSAGGVGEGCPPQASRDT